MNVEIENLCCTFFIQKLKKKKNGEIQMLFKMTTFIKYSFYFEDYQL